MAAPRMLGVLLCYNDGDFVADAIEHLLENRHDVIAWNHGSTDETSEVLERYKPHLRESTFISREVDFYDLYPMMSRHLIANVIRDYDWISWPDQDEILEGPLRRAPYHEYVREAFDSPHNWIEFNDLVYWYTSADDPATVAASARIRHYSLARHGAMKVRAWRASATNIRWFNHNKAEGSRYPDTFNLRHYPMRSEQQMLRRLSVDRANLQHGPVNYHYENMKSTLASRRVAPEDLHRDDGSELDLSMKFNWSDIYGTAPSLPREVFEAFVMTTKRWEIAEIVRRSLSRLPAPAARALGQPRLTRWIDALAGRSECPVMIAIKRDDVKIITEDVATSWTAAGRAPEMPPALSKTLDVMLGGRKAALTVDAATRRIDVVFDAPDGDRAIALLPCYGGEPARLASPRLGAVEFRDLAGHYYYLAAEPLPGQTEARHGD